MKVALIGFGNMAKIIVDAAVKKNVLSMADIVVSSPSLWRGEKKSSYAIAESNVAAATGASIIILASKPPQIPSACNDIKHVVTKNTLIVSIAAGTPFSAIANALENEEIAIIRSMPNTSLAVEEGMTGICKNSFVTLAQEQKVIDLFSAAGKVISVDLEDDLNKITAISGSGPAYFYEIEIAMIEKARRLGFSDEIAHKLVTQTMLGAAKTPINSLQELVDRRNQVTSKGGTTAAALAKFREYKLAETLGAGIDAAYEKAQELSQLQQDTSQVRFFTGSEVLNQQHDYSKQPPSCK